MIPENKFLKPQNNSQTYRSNDMHHLHMPKWNPYQTAECVFVAVVMSSFSSCFQLSRSEPEVLLRCHWPDGKYFPWWYLYLVTDVSLLRREKLGNIQVRTKNFLERSQPRKRIEGNREKEISSKGCWPSLFVPVISLATKPETAIVHEILRKVILIIERSH